jgi:hypothetical protein
MRNLRPLVSAVVVATASVLSALPARAGIVTYSSSSLFLTAAPGLATQDFTFMETRYGARSVTSAASGLNTFTNALRIQPGDIRPGLTISTSINSGTESLGIVGSNYFSSGTNPMIFPNVGGNLSFAFGPSVNAVGMDILGAGQQLFSDVTVDVFSDTNSLLGTYTVSNAPFTGAGKFFGITTDGTDKIGHIDLSVLGNHLVAVSDIQFGTVSDVPEPGALGVCAALMPVGGFFLLRRRRR